VRLRGPRPVVDEYLDLTPDNPGAWVEEAKGMAFELSRRHWLRGALVSAGATACGAAKALASDAVRRSTADPELVLRAFVRALLAFDDPRFPEVSLFAIIQRMSAVANLLEDPGYRAGLAVFDASVSPASESISFSELPLSEARQVVQAWLTSPIPQRRGFVVSTKAVVMIALYSSPKAWQAIHYAGPFDEKFRPSSR
jgi:hypothetical protein